MLWRIEHTQGITHTHRRTSSPGVMAATSWVVQGWRVLACRRGGAARAPRTRTDRLGTPTRGGPHGRLGRSARRADPSALDERPPPNVERGQVRITGSSNTDPAGAAAAPDGYRGWLRPSAGSVQVEPGPRHVHVATVWKALSNSGWRAGGADPGRFAQDCYPLARSVHSTERLDPARFCDLLPRRCAPRAGRGQPN